MTTYLGATPGKLDLRDIDLARLAKTIDALVKSKKGKASTPGTGLHAAPIAPEPPIAPTPVAPTMPKPDAAKKPKVEKPKTKAEKPKLPKLRLSISDSFKTCSVCRAKNISGVDFVGCHCFKALAKQVSVEVMNWGSGFELSFGPDWDQDAVETLQECFNG
jgi:hypothetical protein